MITKGVKSILALASAVVGAGGVTGLVHATPEIAYSTGLACEPLAVVNDKSKIKGPKIKWSHDKEEYSAIPWSGGIDNPNPGRCYKKA